MRVEILRHQQRLVATQIHAVLLLAYAQEAVLLGVKNFPPLKQTAADIQASEEFFLGSYDGKALIGIVSVGPDDEPGQINIASLAVHPAHQRKGVARARKPSPATATRTRRPPSGSEYCRAATRTSAPISDGWICSMALVTA